MARQRIDIPLIEDIEARSLSSTKDAFIKNAYVEKHQSGITIKRRPAFRLVEANNTGTTDRAWGMGKGLASGALYYVTGDGGTGGTLKFIGANSSSTKHASGLSGTNGNRAEIKYVGYRAGTATVIMKSVNDSSFLYYTDTRAVSAGTSESPGFTFGPGVAYLDGYTILQTDREVRASAFEDPTTWSATDSAVGLPTTSELIVWIGNYLNHLVVAGPFSMQIWYNAGNPTGFPFSPRDDLSFPIGIFGPLTSSSNKNLYPAVWTDPVGAEMAFVGTQLSGRGLQVFMMNGLTPQVISNQVIETLLNQRAMTTGDEILVCGFKIRGTTHISVHINFSGVERTFVYDTSSGIWAEWDTEISEFNGSGFPIVFSGICSTDTGGSKMGYSTLVQLRNGDVYELHDTETSDSDGSTEASIYVMIQTPQFGTLQGRDGIRKAMSEFCLHTDATASSNTITLKWSDDDYATFSSGVTLTLNSTSRINRLGSFYNRAFQLTYTATEDLRIFGASAVVEWDDSQ